jgi:sensor c-di-GMP phosphodiesterase-like protein
MKFFSRLTATIVAGVFLTAGLPIAASLNLARRQAIEREQEYLLGQARSALARSETTADQLIAGTRAIAGFDGATICSDAGIDRMRQIDLGSTLLQAVGHVEGTRMTCSSFAGRRGFEVGRPDFISRKGTSIRTDVRLIDPRRSYLMVGYGSFVGIVHKDLVLSFVDTAPDLTAGIFTASKRRLMAARGDVAPAWLDAGFAGDAVFQSGDRMVAIVHSQRYDLGAVASLPIAHAAGFVRQAALILVPLGIAVGLLLSAVLIYVIHGRASLPGLLRQALKACEFHLVYQPVVDLPTGRTVGVEALIRWRRSRGDAMPPDRFVAIAEKAGLMRQLTAHVLDLLAADARSILPTAPGLHIAVNFAADDMHREDVVDQVRDFLGRSGIAPGQLIVEATERSLLDVDLARSTMRRLRAIGVRIAIDDFGTGYSSLGHLAQLEIDFIKIDRIFVQSLGTESASSQVAGRIIDMARDLDLCLIAEGVETAEQERLLGAMAVGLAQGYRYSRPLALEDLLQRLRADRALRPLEPALASL